MKQSILSSAVSTNAHPERLSLIEAKHRALEGRLRELGRRVYLTPSEQIEVTEIKKQKLQAKDEMVTLRGLRF